MSAIHKAQPDNELTRSNYDDVRAQVIKASLGAAPVAVAGRESDVSDICERYPDSFRRIDDTCLEAEVSLETVLLLSPSTADWDQTESWISGSRDARVWATLRMNRSEQDAVTAVAAELREIDRVPITCHRIAWSGSGPDDIAMSERGARLSSETREVLVETAPARDPRTAWALSQRLRALESDLAVYAEREIAHARSRSAEAERTREIEMLKEEIRRKDAILRTTGPISGREAIRAIGSAAKRRLRRGG